MQSSYAEKWKQAAQSEYESLMENQTWTLVLPEGRTPISCKWIFRVKRDVDGNISKWKGRLVARGFTQERGIDYQETFSPVVRFTNVRLLLIYGLQNQMLIHQMDVTTAFLNGLLDEEIYMNQPEGFVQKGKEKLVCKLQRSLYGLKQAPRQWNVELVKHLHGIGFKETGPECCIFIIEFH